MRRKKLSVSEPAGRLQPCPEPEHNTGEVHLKVINKQPSIYNSNIASAFHVDALSKERASCFDLGNSEGKTLAYFS